MVSIMYSLAIVSTIVKPNKLEMARRGISKLLFPLQKSQYNVVPKTDAA
jgi:hypothetical protein